MSKLTGKLTKTWNDYMKPADEREELEGNRALRGPFLILLGGSLLVAWYLPCCWQLTEAHGLGDASSGVTDTARISSTALFLIACLALLHLATRQERRGVHYGSKFGRAATFPLGFSLAYATACSIIVAIVFGAIRCLADVQLVGAETAWVPTDGLVGLFFGILVFVLVVPTLYVSWRSARRSADRMAAELDD